MGHPHPIRTPPHPWHRATASRNAAEWGKDVGSLSLMQLNAAWADRLHIKQ